MHFRSRQSDFLVLMFFAKCFPHLTHRGTVCAVPRFFSLGHFVTKLRPSALASGRRQRAQHATTSGQPVPKPPGLGRLPNKRFCSPTGCKNSKCGHTCPACRFVQARKWVQKTEARALYASSVSLAAFIAWMVASTIFNSFSSREPSMASIRFLHSLPLFLDG